MKNNATTKPTINPGNTTSRRRALGKVALWSLIPILLAATANVATFNMIKANMIKENVILSDTLSIVNPELAAHKENRKEQKQYNSMVQKNNRLKQRIAAPDRDMVLLESQYMKIKREFTDFHPKDTLIAALWQMEIDDLNIIWDLAIGLASMNKFNKNTEQLQTALKEVEEKNMKLNRQLTLAKVKTEQCAAQIKAMGKAMNGNTNLALRELRIELEEICADDKERERKALLFECNTRVDEQKKLLLKQITNDLQKLLDEKKFHERVIPKIKRFIELYEKEINKPIPIHS